MTARHAAVALALVLAAQTSLALADDERARPREGGGQSSAVGERHHGSGGHASSAGSSGSSSSDSGGSSSFAQPLTEAQRRHPRAGTGTGWRRGGGVYYGAPYYLDPYRYSWFGPSYYGGWGYRYYGYSPYYYSGYYGYSPYYYDRYRGYRGGALRILVEPNETRVYVDGYYAGIADDFDGIFQRLHLSPGRHDISLRLDGYRTLNLKVYVPYDQTLKIHHRMARGSSTESSEDVIGRPEDVERDRYGRYEGEREDRDDEAGDVEEEDLGPGNTRGDRGTLRLIIRPSDASVYVDGSFRGTGRLRTLSLPAGRHRVEVVRPGYRTVEREIEVRPGQRAELEVDLEKS